MLVRRRDVFVRDDLRYTQWSLIEHDKLWRDRRLRHPWAAPTCAPTPRPRCASCSPPGRPTALPCCSASTSTATADRPARVGARPRPGASRGAPAPGRGARRAGAAPDAPAERRPPVPDLGPRPRAHRSPVPLDRRLPRRGLPRRQRGDGVVRADRRVLARAAEVAAPCPARWTVRHRGSRLASLPTARLRKRGGLRGAGSVGATQVAITARLRQRGGLRGAGSVGATQVAITARLRQRGRLRGAGVVERRKSRSRRGSVARRSSWRRFRRSDASRDYGAAPQARRSSWRQFRRSDASRDYSAAPSARPSSRRRVVGATQVAITARVIRAAARLALNLPRATRSSSQRSIAVSISPSSASIRALICATLLGRSGTAPGRLCARATWSARPRARRCARARPRARAFR